MTAARPDAEAAFAAALLSPGAVAPTGLRCWNGSDAAARFEVHRNNVVASLIDALADTFPVVQALVGETFFRSMAARYARREPPRLPVLAAWGDTFADFVADFEAARPVPYLADVARLEFARVRAFHAADTPAVPEHELARAMAQADRIGALHFVLHPSLALIASPFAVASIWAAHQDGGDLSRVDPSRPESALVLRDGLEVLVRPVAPGPAAFVDALRCGRGFAAAAAAGAQAQPDMDLAGTLTLLLGHRLVQAVHFGERTR